MPRGTARGRELQTRSRLHLTLAGGIRYTLSMNSSSFRGIIFIVISAVAFSTAGVLIKLVPWNPVALNGARSLFAIVPMYWYLRHTGRRLHVNKSIAIGAAVYAAMLVSFVAANKLTTAANAIVLQFTEPIWVIFLGALVFRNKLRASALVTALVMLVGITLFFLDGIDTAGAWGNALAIVSGVTYAGVFLIKKMDGSDYECSAILGFLVCFAIGLPLYPSQPALELSGWVAVVALGVVQLGLGALFLSLALDHISPVTASLTSTIEPILNPVFVAVFVGETIGPLSLVGAAIVVCAATAYNVYTAKMRPSSRA